MLSEFDKEITLSFSNNNEKIFFNCDKEQIGRVFFNLIKNSIESIQQKSEKEPDFKKKISIEIIKDSNHIKIIIIDNGEGLKNIKGNIKQILNPYYTTKKNGTGLGLAIVNKIINDHNGDLNFFQLLMEQK